ncbi:MAG: hypothetical protein JRE23_14290 [Deltaproteobacteria bacterium]|nr:hypothetical protein [Deltaproteobacteria bacterium]
MSLVVECAKRRVLTVSHPLEIGIQKRLENSRLGRRLEKSQLPKVLDKPIYRPSNATKMVI